MNSARSPRRNDATATTSSGSTLLSWSILFLIIAVVAAVLGFGGVAGSAAGIAKILFVIFLTLFAIGLTATLARGRT